MSDFPNDYGYQLFRVFRVSYLLPNAKGEKYQFNGVSANSWLSSIGHAKERSVSSACPYKPIRAKSGFMREDKSILGTERNHESKLDKDEVLRGITLKSRVLLKDKSNLTQNMNTIPEGFSKKNEPKKRPKTCSGYPLTRAGLQLQHNDLTVTATGLNQHGNSKNGYRQNSCMEPGTYTTASECALSETSRRLHSAPPGLKRPSSRRPSSTIRDKASSPSVWKTRGSKSQIQTGGDHGDKLLREPHLRSLLQKSSSEYQQCTTCPNKCKGFRACLASEEYLSKLKPGSAESLL